MNTLVSNQPQWQAVLHQQRLVNATRWLLLLEDSKNPSALVSEDYDNLLRTLETVLASPETFDLAYRLVQALFSIVFGYADWERWLVYLREALWQSQLLGRRVEQGRLSEQIGDILYHTGDLTAAEISYQESIEVNQHLHDTVNYSIVLAKLAGILSLQGKSAEATSLCLLALAAAEAAGETLAVAHVNLSLSDIYRRAGKWELGLERSQMAYMLYQQLDKPEFVVKALLNLVALGTEIQSWQEVERYAHQLMEMLELSGDVHTLSQLKNNLGVAAYNQGNYKTAESLWQEALNLHSQIQEHTEMAGVYNNLGMVYTQMHEWETAYEMLHKAITAYDKLGDIYNWANAMDNLADLYEAEGKTADCQQTLLIAIKGLQSAEDTTYRHSLLNAMFHRLENLTLPISA